jgi:arsenate reductase-like glutaredoxin family protein
MQNGTILEKTHPELLQQPVAMNGDKAVVGNPPEETDRLY